MFGGTITYPYLLSSKMCITEEDPARGYLIATTLFCSGITTFIQTTFGVRLPIIQGPSFAFLIPTLSLLNLPEWKCDLQNMNATNSEEYSEAWKMRMREVQGSLIVASLVEVIIGCTGIMGLLLRYITPLSIVPVISLIGLSLFQEASGPAGQNWLFSGLYVLNSTCMCTTV
ncbi:Solute carrier family 23 member 2-like protein [Leptotrombidium deliense]|uniref:Solute carrier family 23 member 2-like protein n=1 Tax=Leptotrombidium deliense TaxID=299467 RepID=A0A443RY50_9ACAR|nr:Solute carrier family 23 member 2-like protein [Leptotrombidium deliense]